MGVRLVLVFGWVLASLMACGGPESQPKAPVCGDGVIAGSEVCDGAAFPTTCEALGFNGGDLACADDCTSYSASRCTGATEEPADSAEQGAGSDDAGEQIPEAPSDDGTSESQDSEVDSEQPGETPATPDDAPADDPTPDEGTSDDGDSGDATSDIPEDSNTGGGQDSEQLPDDEATDDGDDGLSTQPDALFTQAGTACNCDSDCDGSGANPGACVYGVCMVRANDVCGSAGSQAECPLGFRCWNLGAATEPVCWPDCDSFGCVGTCDGDNSCVPTAEMNCDVSCGSFCEEELVIPDGPDDEPAVDDTPVDDTTDADGAPGPDTVPTTVPSRDGAVGAPCDSDSDCVSPLSCETSLYPGGYCTVSDCTQTPCPDGTGCYETEGGEPPMCLNSCDGDADCRLGYTCWSPGVCYPNGEGGSGDYRCTEGSCGDGEICTSMGVCTPVSPGVPTGSIPNCESVGPMWNACNPGGGSNSCDELIPFEPKLGIGYWDYPINGETESNQYRSYARRDLMLLIQYAAAQTECLSVGWPAGSGEPLGLGDMSEADGSIPGTSDGDPGHPPNTHENGFDMDIAYFQVGTPDNLLRPVCDHILDGQDQYHCVGEPDLLDVWRTALYLGKLHDNPYVRVIGVDGRVGPLLEDAIDQLCYAGWLTGNVCEPDGSLLSYETEDEGMGWYYFHHHHFHISLTEPGSNAWSVAPVFRSRCLREDCSTEGVERQAVLMPRPVRVLKLR